MPTPRETSIWGNIRSDLNKAQQSILNGQYSEAMILDKSILKTLVRLQIDKAVLVSNNLENDIDQLYNNHLISEETRSNYHTIRLYGERAESGEASSQAANDSFSLIRDELAVYMDSASDSRQSVPSYTQNIREAAQASDEYGDAPEDNADAFDETAVESNFRNPEDLSGTSTGSTPSFVSNIGNVDIPLSNSSAGRGSSQKRASRPTRPLRDSERVTRNQGRRMSPSRDGRPSRRVKRRSSSLDMYNIMKFAIPIACIILLIILIKIIMGGSDKSTIETTPAATTEAVMETTAAAEAIPEETAAPETEAAASVWVTTTGVKVRTEPNTDCEVLDVLDAGVQVTYKGDAGDEWIMIDYNGRDAYLNKQFVQPVASEA